MGNKCCSRRHDPDRPLVYPAYKKNEAGFTACPSLETRYTGEPNNRVTSRRPADIVRTRNPGTCLTNGGRRVVKALCAYTARADSDISFRKGDRMEVLNDAEPDWWRVLHLGTRREGLVPVNFVAEESSVECEDWFFPHVSRKEADKLLLADMNPRGTFLVRPAEHNPHGFSLSVKDWEEGRGYHVKHYKIKPLDNGGFYIATNQTFPSLPALVMSYTKNALGLCHVLARPCPKPEPQMWDLGPELRDKWEIPRTEIQLIRKLGQGNFGEVYYGKWRNNIEVAVKTLREGTMSTQAFLQEAAIMKKFRHKRLVALYAVCSTQEPVYIVQEYMSKGSLLEFLRNGEGKFLQFEDLVYVASQVASGMDYLESKLLIHRDLAARNVLIGDNNIAKICDFGLARVIEDNEYCPKQGSRFPVKWTAPEAIIYGKFSIKSDVWSYGILLMELFTYGQIPYPGLHGKEVIEQVERGYRMPKPVGHYLPDDIYRLMLQCWDAMPEKRPTFEFLNHYFESFTVTSEIPYREAVRPTSHIAAVAGTTDHGGHHGLSCQRSAGRLPRHAALNDVIRRAFPCAGIPAILEPTGLARDEGKRPDGMTVMPWKYGKFLVWDATCTDTVAPSHIQGSAAAAGTAAAAAENLKRRKYNGLSDSYIFVPFGVETLGPWGPEARRLVKELSSRLVEVSKDQRAGSYLSQRISLAIQRGNAASLLGTIPGDGSELKEIFYL